MRDLQSYTHTIYWGDGSVRKLIFRMFEPKLNHALAYSFRESLNVSRNNLRRRVHVSIYGPL